MVIAPSRYNTQCRDCSACDYSLTNFYEIILYDVDYDTIILCEICMKKLKDQLQMWPNLICK